MKLASLGFQSAGLFSVVSTGECGSQGNLLCIATFCSRMIPCNFVPKSRWVGKDWCCHLANVGNCVVRFTAYFYLLVSWAWWDWPLTWLTNHCPSVLWHCWLGHVTRKIFSKVTYNVSSGTLNCTILYHTTAYLYWCHGSHCIHIKSLAENNARPTHWQPLLLPLLVLF